MTETMTQTMTDNIASLKAAVREASQHERVLALEVDALPQRVQQAARQDARNKAKAAREDAENRRGRCRLGDSAATPT
jgi:peptidoglycan hydrolase CwlO-like protein